MTRLFLRARLAGQTVAIAADDVESVVEVGTIVAVPGVPAAVRGLVALRSRVATVIDPAEALGHPPSSSTRAVVTMHDGQLYAILVDSLDDVAPAGEHPPIAGLVPAGGWAAAARGTILQDGRPVLTIDLRDLIPLPAEAAA